MPAPNAAIRYLGLDLNSFFASVEQQANPHLRARPVAVVPIAGTDSTCAIAASYEAKALGIVTGTRIYEAKKICPDIAIVPARHDIYVEYHHRILRELGNHLPVDKIYSIDDIGFRLIGDERIPENAVAIARRMKRGIAANVGECLRCSIGLAPTPLLAKLGCDMQKPDGLVVLPQDELPAPLLHLGLTDISGIGRSMEERLHKAGIRTVAELWALEPKHMRRIWNSVVGERFWYALHGHDVPDIETGRRMIGHSRVLGGEHRKPAQARLVARELVLKAAKRLRRYRCTAGAIALSLRDASGERWHGETGMMATQDSFALLARLDDLWRRSPAARARAQVKSVSAWLYDLAPVASRQGDLFGAAGPQDPAQPSAREKLWARVDDINLKYGRSTVALGSQRKLALAYLGAKIAFNRVPDEVEFRE